MNDELTIPPELAASIRDLYRRMQEAYDVVARQLDFSCQGCPDNCCNSYFLHHTRLEWAWLWEGLRALPAEQLAAVQRRAEAYRQQEQAALAAGRRPEIMCPLNEEGRCILYDHRLMICRLHGVPSSLTFPDGRRQQFPGCFRCQELVAGRDKVPTVERASLLRELAQLEQDLGAAHGLPALARARVKKSIAEMICQGPPRRP
ncbi:hypothetical protein [Desulfurivibrio alkaliphilus]|uniref:YkgJ family cysteine cluster protein n=1 Tax=Desulfurivibrio alkaliphilus (strain DSM 19089 / UNIQEM U267 / AHT2) TaxID=589865 RepID=D6Z547_DESAT|nr:hypothetical protein [Desulfurivibrio alkaliphilus]ADH86672.1 conserved hypothetical protein [Desulfurivibrio alkaliphilus AHT 2]